MANRPVKDFRIQVLTWCVGQISPLKELKDILRIEHQQNGPDMFAIGLQGMRPVPTAKGLLTKWVTPLKDVLYPLDYVKVLNQRHYKMRIVIFVKRVHITYIRNIRVTPVATGPTKILGNEGAIIVSFKLYGVSVCLVNSHLPVKDDPFKGIENYNTITDRTLTGTGPETIFKHDYVLWFGGQNFRLNSGIEAEFVRDLVKPEIMRMLKFDTMKEPDAVLMEAPVKFPPTSKFIKDKNEYDISAGAPAWTDRILYYHGHLNNDPRWFKVTVNDYCSLGEFNQSDHKPVSGSFTISVFDLYKEVDRVHFEPIIEWNCSPEGRREFQFSAPAHTKVEDDDRVLLVQKDFNSLSVKNACFVNSQRHATPEYKDLCDPDVATGVRHSQPLRHVMTLGYDLVKSVVKNDDDYEKPDLPTPRNIYSIPFGRPIGAPGTYRLVYMRNNKDVLGVSDPFVVKQDQRKPVKRWRFSGSPSSSESEQD